MDWKWKQNGSRLEADWKQNGSRLEPDVNIFIHKFSGIYVGFPPARHDSDVPSSQPKATKPQ